MSKFLFQVSHVIYIKIKNTNVMNIMNCNTPLNQSLPNAMIYKDYCSVYYNINSIQNYYFTVALFSVLIC